MEDKEDSSGGGVILPERSRGETVLGRTVGNGSVCRLLAENQQPPLLD